MAKKKKLKAFAIGASFSLPGGRRYRKTDFYQAKDHAEEEVLGKAQFAYELEDDAKAPAPPPAPAKTPAPKSDDEGSAYEEDKTDEPDWSYQTIKAMRSWLDKSGVELCGARASKSTHEALCRDAWAAGRRPNPLYGYPGGPEPSAGFPGPAVGSSVVLANAIEAAHSGGFPVPEETTNALEELRALEVAAADASDTDGDKDAQKGAGEPDGGPIDAEGSEPSESRNDAATEPLEVLVDGDGDELECEGCERAPATHEGSEGTPLCQACWDAIVSDTDETADDHQADHLVVAGSDLLGPDGKPAVDPVLTEEGSAAIASDAAAPPE